MDEKLEQQRQYSLYLCDRLTAELNRNKEDAAACLGGEIYKAYVKATESAINKARRTKNKIRNL